MAGLTAFEVAVLREVNFASLAIPFGGDGRLAWRLKMLGKRVFTNDIQQSKTCRAIAAAENNGLTLNAALLDTLLAAAHDAAEDPDFPINGGLLRWFAPSEARWLEGFRQAALAMPERIVQALAMSLGLRLGDYRLAFDETARELRRPLEDVAIELSPRLNLAVDNRQANAASNLDARQFVFQAQADAVYVRFPAFEALDRAERAPEGWREVWTSGSPAIWRTITLHQRGTFGGRFLTRSDYQTAVASFLKRLDSFPQWIISASQSPAMTLEELTGHVERCRPVERTFTKDAGECAPGLTQYILICRPK
jgi:hypothetical protein